MDFIPERLKKKIKDGTSFININLGEEDYIDAIKDNVKKINQTISVTEETARELEMAIWQVADLSDVNALCQLLGHPLEKMVQ